MQQRFTVRKNKNNPCYWDAFDRQENKVARTYAHKSDIQQIVKMLNKQYKAVS